jgi:hypothetical protein
MRDGLETGEQHEVDERGGDEQRVDAVQHAPVTREQRTHVLQF